MKTRKHKRTVIVNKKRFSAFLAVMFLMTCFGISSIRNRATAADELQFIAIQVKPGDSLWSIAQKNNSCKKNVRVLVNDIKKHNNLKSNTIYAGDELLIPCYSA